MKLIDKKATTTSNGCLSKAWYRDDYGEYIVKGNTLFNDKSIGYEPISEVIAFKVACILGIPCARSVLKPSSMFPDVKTHKLKYVSVTDKISDLNGCQRFSAITMMEMYWGRKADTDYWNTYLSIKTVDREAFINMLVFDAVIGNVDRHLNNWELFINGRGGMVQAPLFDNGASLLALVKDKDLSLHFSIGVDKSKPFKDSHTRQVALIKRTFPSFKLNLSKQDLDILWGKIESAIEPELNLLRIINSLRADCVKKYLHNRLYHYLTTLSEV